MRSLMATILFSVAALMSSCTNKIEPTVATPVNVTCPIMGGKVTPDGGSTTWNDQLIGFCCDSCIPEWDELSDEQKAKKLADAKRGQVQHDEQDGQHPNG